MAKRYDILLRILLIGDSGVGKTCVICRFAEDKFHPKQSSTIGIDFMIKRTHVDGKKVRIQCWDTAGQEKYSTITKQYYRRAQGIFLVYDITNRKTFENLDKWHKCILENARDDVELILVANKMDMAEARRVTSQEGRAFAAARDIDFYEVSAKSADNIHLVFQEMAERIVRTHREEFSGIVLEREDSEGGEYVSELEQDQAPRQGCCS